MDIVILCLGVNDIMQGKTADEIISCLEKIVKLLIASDVRVIIQSVPPFDYSGENIKKWNTVNKYKG